MKVLNQGILEMIRILPSDVPPESGGILGGRNGIITDVVMDRGKRPKTPCSYTPDTAFLNREIEKWAERDIEFMGLFHVHFGGAETLSQGDKTYIARIMDAMPENLTWLYFPVVVMPERKVVAYKAVRRNGEVLIQRDTIENQGGI